MNSPSSKFSLEGSSPGSPTSTRSGYPFPETLSRQSTNNRYRSRRGSNGSISSIGGSLDTRSNPTVRETSQNAISTLLQPPIVRTGLLPHTAGSAAAAGYKAPTQKDIPPVALTNIPHVPPENFRDYLSRIAPLFESFQRGRSEPDQAQWLKKDKELEKTDRFAEALERRLSKEGSASPRSPMFSPTPQTPTLDRRRSSGTTHRRNRNEPTPLSTIPSVYFEEDFHLENPRTFDIVSERAELLRPAPGTPRKDPSRKSLATNAILQEKLSWYMDTVEVHLINSISAASAGFFTALGSLKELQSEAEQSVARIQSLREDLRRLDREVAGKGLEVAAKRRRRANLSALGRATEQVRRVVEDVKRTDELVESAEYDEAADQMERVGRLVCGEGEEDERLIDLRPLKALQGLDAGLQELQLKIGTGFANRLTSLLLSDLRAHIDKVPRPDTLKRWSRQRGIQPTYLETSPQFRTDLLAALKGLQRAGHTAPAAAAYREAVTKEVKNIIRRYLPSSNDDDADSMVSTATASTRGGGKITQQEKSSILARNLRALDPEDAEALLMKVYTAVGEALRRVGTQTKVLLDLSSGSLSPTDGKPGHSRSSSYFGGHSKSPSMNGAPSDQDIKNPELDSSLDLSSLLGQAVDTAQTQISRVLKVRNEQSIRLPKDFFLRYFSLNRLFADECEAVSGRGGQVLKGIINAQISGFVQVLGTQETEKIVELLERESWNAVDFSLDSEAVLGRILQSMTSDPPSWANQTRPIWESAAGNGTAHTNGEAVAPTNGTVPATTPKASTKAAFVDETRYILVPSTTSLLPSVETFLSLTPALPSMTPQIANALLEVLRTFNSRTCQLVLGAGATKGSAGLKNITTKHLALASQSVGFIVALIPYLRECVRRHLPQSSTSVLAEFDKTKRLLQDHQQGIREKLIEIMLSRSATHIKAMKNTDWAALPADAGEDSEKASAYMETLTKETLTLYRVLGRYLGEGEVRVVMGGIGEGYREQWTNAIKEVVVEGEAGEKVLLRDARVMESRLGKVEGLEGVGGDVVKAVEGRGKEEKEAGGKKETNGKK